MCMCVYTHLPVVSVNYARQNITSSSSKSATTSVASAAIAQAQWSMVSAVGIQVHIETTLRTLQNAIIMVSNFHGSKFFVKQAQIRASEIFAVSFFSLCESGTCVLACCTAKTERISRMVNRERLQPQLFVPIWGGLFVEAIASTLGPAPLSGSFIYAYIAL